MRILYIVGNGFDLNLGLKTDYPSFYKYYLKQETPDQTIKKLKENIASKQYTTWSDLESGLGEYAEKCTKEEYIHSIDDVRMNLTAFLKDESGRIGFSITQSFFDDLNSPEQYLEGIVLEDYKSYCNDYINDSKRNSVDIITFNYTYTFEKILGVFFEMGDSIINFKRERNGFTLNQLIHIHGTLDNELNVGVNDNTQIKNDTLKDDPDVIENAVKPIFNDACLNNNNGICEGLINEADIIVLFGVSMGITDSRWWSLIGSQIRTRPCVVMYYPYDEKKDGTKHPNLKRRWMNYYTSVLKEKMGVSDDKDSANLGHIVVSINKPLFKNVTTRNLKEGV